MKEIDADLGIPFISTGFPSPAEDFTELPISLDKYLIQNPAATFMAYANGDSMLHTGINHGDILIIDRSLNAIDGDTVIGVLYGEFTVKQLSIVNGTIFLLPEKAHYSPIEISHDMDFEIWGVIIYSIRNHR